ncbi:alpha/beta-hydrolase [Aspergillus ellipticus CBS 707.79]|uniref:Alpha/beta-hydrolase n=1 Tax=Aspergillus ellipticus CBS 707.79 TaxID=1448320 RepID=A0A319DIH9_9EURO|nr:alpha/beta-hydrolase [Aspergillus ellipticus CBS 707.79]
MLRHRAADPSKKIGNLIFNPGGPGDNATVYVAYAEYAFGSAVVEHFDIIGLDPRGVGLSSPIKCDADIYNQRVSLYPSTQSGLDDLVNKYKMLGESCLNMTGSLVAHMDSASVAKDMEAIRVGLGGGKINYLGLSYGTIIGAEYAELFPQNIRAMTLDGNMDHNEDPTTWMMVQTSAYEIELVRFAEWCSTSSTCPLNGTDVLGLWDDLVKQANETPIPAPGCKVSGTCRENVTGEEIQLNSNSYLLFKDGLFTSWAGFGLALLEASQGNATLLSTTLAVDDSSDSFQSTVIHCLDFTHPKNSLEEIAYKQQLTAALTPHTNTTGTSNNECIGWPIPQKNKEHNANIHGTPPILQVSAQYDPSTSYIWADGLRTQIANSTILTRKGDGHTSYWLFGETSKAIDSYLVNLTLPAPNTMLDS